MKRTGTLIYCLLLMFVSRAADQKDELYAQRLGSLKSTVEFTYNEIVRREIDSMLVDPEMPQILARCQIYFPGIEKQLREKQLPIELKYMVVAASGADNEMISPTGATGWWRMMYNVARTYGIKINSFVDERKDPVHSTEAATSYLKDLNAIYNNWQLTLAAYACTPAILNKAIRQSGYKMNFWEIYPLLPAESKEMVPQFIAAAYVFNFHKEHGFVLQKPQLLISQDTVSVNKWLSFAQISATLAIEEEQLYELNPVFKKGIIPLSNPPYIINLPKGKAKLWGKLKDSVYIYVPRPVDMSPISVQKAEPKIPDTAQKAAVGADGQATTKKENEEKASEEKTGFNKKRIMYVVKKGDVLGDICDWYDVSLTQVKSWNKMHNNKIAAGKKLIIWEPTERFAYYSRINKMTRPQKNKLKNKD